MNIVSKMGKNVTSTPKLSSYETRCLKMFSTPNQSRKVSEQQEGWKRGSPVTVRFPMVSAMRAAKVLVCPHLPPSTADDTWVSVRETVAQTFPLTLKICPLNHPWSMYPHVIIETKCPRSALNTNDFCRPTITATFPWIRVLKHKTSTHHDDQENILKVLSVAKSVGEEKCKVSFQQL